MNYPLELHSKALQFIEIRRNILQVCLWSFLLWVWANLLEMTPDMVDIIIVLITAAPAIFFFWKMPEYGLITLMFFSSAFLAPNIVDIRLPLFGGFELRDILLILMFGLSFFKSLGRTELRIPWWPVGGFLLAFLSMVLFSLAYALLFEQVPGNWAFSDARILFFYTVFFITAWTIRSRHSLYLILIGSFVIADLTSAIVLIQQRLGAHNYLIQSMHDSSWQVWEVDGATRVVPPGIVYMYFMLLASMGITLFWQGDFKTRLFWIGQTAFLSLGIIFTFTRSAWVAIAITLVLMLIIAFPFYRAQLGRVFFLGLATALLFGSIVFFVDDRFSVDNAAAEGVIDRFMSIFTVEDTLETNSLQWRNFEIQEATKAIQESPFLGVGLGNSYRDITVFQGESLGQWTDGLLYSNRLDRFTRYVHSSYFALTVKMGIPAMIIYLCFYGAAILQSLSLHLRLPNGMAKGLVLALGMGLVGLLQWSFLHAHLILVSSTAVLGVIMGLLAGIHYVYISYPQMRAGENQ